MLALLLSLGLLTLFSFLGGAFVELLGPSKNPLRRALMAPGAGAALMVLPLFVLNQLNIPVERFAWPMTIVLVLAAAAVLWRKRPSVSIRELSPFLIILSCAAILTGYPMLLYGFNWISYGNYDMCSYVMTAHRFVTHGYYELPDPAAVLSNRDIGSSHWAIYAIEGARCGGDLLLAWLISLTKMTGFELYMPLTLALHLGLIAATGALVLFDGRLRAAAIVTCTWLTLSPSNMLGTMYQLMPQVFGVMLLALSGAMLLQPIQIASPRELVRFSLFAGVLVTALVIVYYEVLPFLAVGVALYHVVQMARGRESLRSLVAPALGIAVVVVFVLRSWLLSIVPFMQFQVTRSFVRVDPNRSLFPYYLVASGLANFWGFVPIGGGQFRGWVMDSAVVAGALLLVVAAAVSLWQAWKGNAAAVLCLVMFVVGLRLYINGGDYGLFKLAMFIQPFLLGTLAVPALTPSPAGNARIRLLSGLFLIAIIAVPGVPGEVFYIKRSLGGPGSFVNVPGASSVGLLEQLAKLRAAPHASEIISDANDAVLASFEGIYLNPAELEIPAADFFENPMTLDPTRGEFRMGQWLRPRLAEAALRISQERQKLNGIATFDLKSEDRQETKNRFFRWRGPAGSNYELLESGLDTTPLNRRTRPLTPLRFQNPRAISDHLILVASELGGNAGLVGIFGPDKRVSLYPSEPDYFFRGAMTSIGRYLLFQILNPAQQVRLIVDYTATLNSDGENRIPPIQAIGEARTYFAASGRGAGRFFSAVIDPQRIEGNSYLMLDMGREPALGFVREISAISDEEYQMAAAPAELSHFPADLGNPNLEFSGVYEDGWASEDTMFVLHGSSRLKVEGMAPFGPIEITLRVDGQEAAKQKFKPGDFTMQSGELRPGKHRIEIHASIARRLQSPDTRKAAYLIRRVGF